MLAREQLARPLKLLVDIAPLRKSFEKLSLFAGAVQLDQDVAARNEPPFLEADGRNAARRFGHHLNRLTSARRADGLDALHHRAETGLSNHHRGWREALGGSPSAPHSLFLRHQEVPGRRRADDQHDHDQELDDKLSQRTRSWLKM
jgi:hypothetical protein